MTMKKKILTTLSVVLILGMAALGILAYMQDDAYNTNVMTLGNVYIEQHEYDAAGNEVTNGKFGDLYPGMEVVKKVNVENTGESDAYVRTFVAFETIESETFKNDFAFDDRGGYTLMNGWNTPVFEFELEGVKYEAIEFLHNNPVKSGETTGDSLTKVALGTSCTNEDMEALGGTYEVLVLSQAVQIESFDDAKTALDTAFGVATNDTVAKWFGEAVSYVEAGGEKDQITGEEAAKILENLEAGKDLVVNEDVDILGFDANEVDAKGATVTLAGQGEDAYGYLAFMPDAGEAVELSNLNVTGSGFVEVGDWSQGGGEYTVNNVKVENLASTLANGDKGFTLACAFCHYGNAVLNNCVMTGATAVQAGAMPVDLGCVNDTTTVINGGEYGTVYCWSHSVVTIDGADVDTLYASPIKGTVTVKAGTHVGTLNVDYGTSTSNITKARLVKLVIEDGATVDTIVHQGTEYTVEQWNDYVANF